MAILQTFQPLAFQNWEIGKKFWLFYGKNRKHLGLSPENRGSKPGDSRLIREGWQLWYYKKKLHVKSIISNTTQSDFLFSHLTNDMNTKYKCNQTLLETIYGQNNSHSVKIQPRKWIIEPFLWFYSSVVIVRYLAKLDSNHPCLTWAKVKLISNRKYN